MKHFLRGIVGGGLLTLMSVTALANDNLYISGVTPPAGDYPSVTDAVFSFVNTTGENLAWDGQMSYVYLKKGTEAATTLNVTPAVNNTDNTITIPLNFTEEGTYTVYIPYYALYTETTYAGPDPETGADGNLIPEGLDPELPNIGYCYSVTYTVTGASAPLVLPNASASMAQANYTLVNSKALDPLSFTLTNTGDTAITQFTYVLKYKQGDAGLFQDFLTKIVTDQDIAQNASATFSLTGDMLPDDVTGLQPVHLQLWIQKINDKLANNTDAARTTQADLAFLNATITGPADELSGMSQAEVTVGMNIANAGTETITSVAGTLQYRVQDDTDWTPADENPELSQLNITAGHNGDASFAVTVPDVLEETTYEYQWTPTALNGQAVTGFTPVEWTLTATPKPITPQDPDATFSPESGETVEELKDFTISLNDDNCYPALYDGFYDATSGLFEDYFPDEEVPEATIEIKENGVYVPYTGNVTLELGTGDLMDYIVTFKDTPEYGMPSGDYRITFPQGFFFYMDKIDRGVPCTGFSVEYTAVYPKTAEFTAVPENGAQLTHIDGFDLDFDVQNLAGYDAATGIQCKNSFADVNVTFLKKDHDDGAEPQPQTLTGWSATRDQANANYWAISFDNFSKEGVLKFTFPQDFFYYVNDQGETVSLGYVTVEYTLARQYFTLSDMTLSPADGAIFDTTLGDITFTLPGTAFTDAYMARDYYLNGDADGFKLLHRFYPNKNNTSPNAAVTSGSFAFTTSGNGVTMKFTPKTSPMTPSKYQLTFPEGIFKYTKATGDTVYNAAFDVIYYVSEAAKFTSFSVDQANNQVVLNFDKFSKNTTNNKYHGVSCQEGYGLPTLTCLRPNGEVFNYGTFGTSLVTGGGVGTTDQYYSLTVAIPTLEQLSNPDGLTIAPLTCNGTWTFTFPTGFFKYNYNVPIQGFEVSTDVTGTGVEDVNAEMGNGEVEYFNLQGQRVSEPKAGNIYLRRSGSRVSKVLF